MKEHLKNIGVGMLAALLAIGVPSIVIYILSQIMSVATLLALIVAMAVIFALLLCSWLVGASIRHDMEQEDEKKRLEFEATNIVKEAMEKIVTKRKRARRREVK